MFKYSSTKTKLIINGVLLVLGAVLYVGLWYGTSYVSGIIETRQVKLSESENALARFDQTEKVLLETKSEREQVNGYILSDDGVVHFIESLESLAHGIGLEQNTEAVSEAAYPGLDSAKWGGLQVVFSVKGRWTPVYQLLSLLERLPYRTELVRAAIEKESIQGESKTASDLWKGEFVLRVLKRK